jgi:hypothetical protein
VISFVNGFLCTSGCDVAKARRGEDPHPKPDPTQPDGKADDSPGIVPASEREETAVLFGGALADLSASRRVNAAAATGGPEPVASQDLASTVDLLV